MAGDTCVLWIYADRYGLELSRRRCAFKAISFSLSLADDGCGGTVTLLPQMTILSVGNGEDDYSCVRIFNDDARVVGTMRRSPAGEVSWYDVIKL